MWSSLGDGIQTGIHTQNTGGFDTLQTDSNEGFNIGFSRMVVRADFHHLGNLWLYIQNPGGNLLSDVKSKQHNLNYT